MIKNPDTDDGQKKFLDEVRRIRCFAADTIGLAENRNYTSYIRIDKKYLLDVVAASLPDTFSQYHWWFPFVGSVPYKGFFIRRDAVGEAKKLRDKGYDVTIGAVDAFSSLGFLRDPVYSFMGGFSRYRLASLIIHEQTHATLYLKNQTAFNEQLATYIGDEGALLYIRRTFGDSSSELHDALREKKDYETWQTKLGELHETLTDIYTAHVSREDRVRLKQEAIGEFKKSLTEGYSTLFQTELFRGIEKAEINNAYIAVRMNYYKDLSLMYELQRKSGGDYIATVRQLLSLKNAKGDPLANVKKMVLDP
ncbi:MAG: aminopeptidase [Chitinispirillaceae bacterium]|nr:aminopeptidase [Chitinispirillaceae bacterium]